MAGLLSFRQRLTMRYLGFRSALAVVLLASASAAMAQPAQRPAPPAAASQKASPDSGIVVPEGAAEKLKPPASFLVDCKDLPKDAVTAVPAAIERWSTLYCTQNGQLFSSNERYFSAFPGTGLRGAFLAGELSGRPGPSGRPAYFKKITYEPLPPADAKKLEVGLGPQERQLLKDKPLFRIDLTVDTGQTNSMVVINPDADPFWVIPIVGNKLNRAGFYVASLDYVNRKR
jgi:hypothetical protein